MGNVFASVYFLFMFIVTFMSYLFYMVFYMFLATYSTLVFFKRFIQLQYNLLLLKRIRANKPSFTAIVK